VGTHQPPRQAASRTAPQPPPTAVRCVSRRRSSFFVLSGLEGTYAVTLTAPAIYSTCETRPARAEALARGFGASVSVAGERSDFARRGSATTTASEPPTARSRWELPTELPDERYRLVPRSVTKSCFIGLIPRRLHLQFTAVRWKFDHSDGSDTPVTRLRAWSRLTGWRLESSSAHRESPAKRGFPRRGLRWRERSWQQSWQHRPHRGPNSSRDVEPVRPGAEPSHCG
jgi:hypothetical protein